MLSSLSRQAVCRPPFGPDPQTRSLSILLTRIMIVTLFFWPAVAASILVAFAGALLRKTTQLLVAAALVLPASAYLAATPRFEVWGLFPVGAYLLAAMAIRWLDGLPVRTTSLSLIAGNAWFFADLSAGVSRFPLSP